MNLVDEVHQLHADICSALADPKRILILYALADEPLNVGSLATRLGMSQPATSRHLKTLRAQGMVRAERQGLNIEYQLTDRRLIQALDLLRDVLRDRIQYRAGLMELDEQA